jgi:hypothetical protein
MVPTFNLNTDFTKPDYILSSCAFSASYFLLQSSVFKGQSVPKLPCMLLKCLLMLPFLANTILTHHMMQTQLDFTTMKVVLSLCTWLLSNINFLQEMTIIQIGSKCQTWYKDMLWMSVKATSTSMKEKLPPTAKLSRTR